MNQDRIKILIVDDSDFLREAIKKFLEDYECDVFVSPDGLTGIQNIYELKPSLIFLDVLLPTINGIDLLKVIKMFEETKVIPVIIITATKDEYLIKQCIDLGVQKVLYKPLTRKVIFNSVEEVIGKQILSKVKLKKYVGELPVHAKEETLHPKSHASIRRELVRFFMKQIDRKKADIISALESKNEIMMRNLMHEIKGTGGTIGYPKLTLVCEHLEKILNENMDEYRWREVEIYSMEVMALLDLIHEENT